MHKIEVPYIDQSVKYPTGCESVSAVMLLQYLGYDITVEEFIDRYLECRPMEMTVTGSFMDRIRYQYFCGSPYDSEILSGFMQTDLLTALD